MKTNTIFQRTLLASLVLAACVGIVASFGSIASAQQVYFVPTCNIYANPSTVNNYGGTTSNYTTLTWNSTNANSANLTNVGSVSTSGTQTMYPSVTTTYILNVYNSQGQSAQCQTTVTVNTSSSGAPSCWITLSNYGGSYNYNQPATLSWGSTNATSANISPNVGSISTSGSQTVYPSGNQLYTMTVYNSQGQTATCQTSQYTSGNLSCNIYANPLNIQNGQSSYLTWNSTGATSAWLSDGLGNVGTNGSLTVRPESSRTYTLTVSDYQNRTQSCNAYVTVSGSYVTLTQIPYTGFDFGAVGNTLYWITLVLFALAAGYLAVYFLPSISLSRRMSPRPAQASSVQSLASSNRSASNARIAVPAIFQRGAPSDTFRASASVPETLPTVNELEGNSRASDSMDFAQSENGVPRIVITRD